MPNICQTSQCLWKKVITSLVWNIGSFIINIFVCLFVSVSVGARLHTDAHTQARRGCWVSAVTGLESEAHSQLNWQQWALAMLCRPWPGPVSAQRHSCILGLGSKPLVFVLVQLLAPGSPLWPLFIICLFVYFERVFCSTGWPRTCCVVMDDIESVIVLDFTHCGYRTAGFMYARQASYQPSYILSPIFFSCLNLFS